VSSLDAKVELAADKLQELADRFAAEGGTKAKFAEPLAEDAAFLRKLKPSLIAARAKGHAPTNQQPGRATLAPSSPQLGKRPRPKKKPGKGGGGGGPNPWVVVGAALVTGILLAKVVDWRGHAHPRG
jgi:hypothetical protein